MSKKILLPILVSIGMIFLSGCNLISSKDKKDSGNANMPNPASVFCEENGGTLDIRTAEDGSQSGFCVFPDGSECDEWAYYRGECKPGDSLNMDANMPNPASVFCEENGGTVEIQTAEDGSQSGICVFTDGSRCDEWAFFRGECQPGATPSDSSTDSLNYDIEKASDGCNVYIDHTLGYSLHFPSDSTIIENDEPTRSFTIEGPLVNDEHWPVIFIAHPQDREDYRPPEDADLLTWLQDKYLIDGEFIDEIQIGGTKAIHTRIESVSGQSYNIDHYFFAHKNQLYSIVFLHTDGKEDWDLYNHILGSFEFSQ